jgi:hypothetical protein
MCPACFTTAALVMAGVSSAGGLTAFVLGRRSGARARGDAQCDAPENPSRGDRNPNLPSNEEDDREH